MIKRHQILQVLPNVPPAVCGVGDYAWSIARRLQADHGIYSSFLAAGTSAKRVPSGETELPVYRLPSLTARSLVDFLESRSDAYSSIILHMSSYGYHKRGVPLWLASGWQRVFRLQHRPRLITMYHELAASGPVMSSAFWLGPVQKWLMRRVARASDGLRTNRERYADWLLKIPGIDQENVVTMPVHSNFGEPEVLPLWHEREPAMVMFAWGISSGESLQEVVAKAAHYCRQFGLNKLHLIGGKGAPEMTHPGVEMRRYGFMESEDISKLLLSCRMAYTAYNPEYFGKSTLMAAFASHGLVVICQGKTPRLSDGLQHGVHVLNEASLCTEVNMSALPFDTLAAALRGWYDQHSLAKNAASYAGQLHSVQVRA